MPTHSVSPIIIAGGLILIYNFFALKTERVVQYHRAMPLLVPCVGVMTMGRGSSGSWVNCVMGHMGHRSQNLTHFHL